MANVSVIIPTHNSALFIRETIDSVLNQSYQNFDIVVIDDCSTDNTEHIVRDIKSQKITYVRLSSNSGGPSKPRNIGIDKAEGKLIAFFDSDDLMMPNKLQEQVDLLQNHSDMPLVFSNFDNFDIKKSIDFLHDHHDFQQMKKITLSECCYKILSADAFETLIGDYYIGTSSIVAKKEIFKDVGYFDESLKNSEDADLLYRITRRYDIGFIDKMLHRRRLHEANISRNIDAGHYTLKSREKLKNMNLSTRERKRLNKNISGILFSIGYGERIAGNKLNAVKFYLRCWWYRKTNIMILKSIIRALMPF